MSTRQNTRQTQQSETTSENQVHPDFASVENTDGVTFSDGVMMVSGEPQIPEEVQQWESSNGLTQYATVLWKNPITGEKRCSCNCPGWAIKKPGKPRRCKHTDDMMGIKVARAKRAGTVQITSVSQAATVIPKFQGRPLRGIMLN